MLCLSEELALRLQNEELSQLQEVSEIEPDVVLPPPPQTKDEYELIAAQEERRRRNNREHVSIKNSVNIHFTTIFLDLFDTLIHHKNFKKLINN